MNRTRPFLLALALIGCLGEGAPAEPDREQAYGAWDVYPGYTSEGESSEGEPRGTLRLTPERYTFEAAKGQEALVERYRMRVPFIRQPKGAVQFTWPDSLFGYVKFDVKDLSEREYGIEFDEQENRLRFVPMFSVAFSINDQPLVIKRLAPAAE